MKKSSSALNSNGTACCHVFPDGMTARNIRLLLAEIERELRKYLEDADPQ